MPCPNAEKPLQAIESLQGLFREMVQKTERLPNLLPIKKDRTCEMLLFNIEFCKIAGLYGYCAGNAIKGRRRVSARTGYNRIGPSADRNVKNPPARSSRPYRGNG